MQNTERFIFIENSIVLISTEEEIVMKQGMKTKKKEQQGIFKKWLLGLVLVGVITAEPAVKAAHSPQKVYLPLQRRQPLQLMSQPKLRLLL